MLHRHGSRYPTTDSGVQKLGATLTALVRTLPFVPLTFRTLHELQVFVQEGDFNRALTSLYI